MSATPCSHTTIPTHSRTRISLQVRARSQTEQDCICRAPCTTSADIIIINKCKSSPTRGGGRARWRTTIYGMSVCGSWRASAKLELICGTRTTTKALLLTWPRNGETGRRPDTPPVCAKEREKEREQECGRERLLCCARWHFKIYVPKLILLTNNKNWLLTAHRLN